jgi:hypothetical protein
MKPPFKCRFKLEYYYNLILANLAILVNVLFRLLCTKKPIIDWFFCLCQLLRD